MDSKDLEHWADPFRRWCYHPGLVLSAEQHAQEGFSLVDGPNVFWHRGSWRRLYFGFDGRGYQSCLASSDDLIHWQPHSVVLSFGERGRFDYGGVAMVGPLLQSNDIRQVPQLKKWRDRYWVVYGCYPQQGGYELGHGGQGLVWSENGFDWQRYSETTPVFSVDGAEEWENRVLYSPCIVEHGQRFFNFYNAKGDADREQIGLALSTDLVHWQRYAGNPVIRNGTTGYDRELAADAKIYWHDDHWVMFCFGASTLADGQLHAQTLAAFSTDLFSWIKYPHPVLVSGGHPAGLDRTHAHNVSLVYRQEENKLYLFYCAVGDQGRGIALATTSF